MNPQAVLKSSEKFRAALKAITRMRAEPIEMQKRDDWQFFLVAFKGIYTVLEQGAKASAQSRQWFGAKKAQRKADPMLDYLFHARNDEEHGLENSADMLWPLWAKVEGGRTYTAKLTKVGEQDVFTCEDEMGNFVPVGGGPPRLRLVHITLRGGKRLDPPVFWNGMVVTETELADIADGALQAIRPIILEAREMCIP